MNRKQRQAQGKQKTTSNDLLATQFAGAFHSKLMQLTTAELKAGKSEAEMEANHKMSIDTAIAYARSMFPDKVTADRAEIAFGQLLQSGKILLPP